VRSAVHMRHDVGVLTICKCQLVQGLAALAACNSSVQSAWLHCFRFLHTFERLKFCDRSHITEKSIQPQKDHSAHCAEVSLCLHLFPESGSKCKIPWKSGIRRNCREATVTTVSASPVQTQISNI